MSIAVEVDPACGLADHRARSSLRASTFAHLSALPRFIPRRPSDGRGKRGGTGLCERHELGRRPKLAGRVRFVRMLAWIRRIRRRRV